MRTMLKAFLFVLIGGCAETPAPQAPPPGELPCPTAGQSKCSGVCLDLRVDSANCGTCGNTCSAPNADIACVGGVCAFKACKAGFDNCDGATANGCEARLDTSANCGICNNVCGGAGAASRCEKGACVYACLAGFSDCDKQAVNGCEVAINTDTSNCGTCAVKCSAANIVPACNNGRCVGACESGYADCNADKQNDGCEVNSKTDAGNCGGCGVKCGGGATCQDGACKCPFPLALCAGVCTDLNADPKSCGSCGKQCLLNMMVCANGVCALVCPQGQTACNGACADTNTNFKHCGDCNAACSVNNISNPTCKNGACDGPCNLGFADCDGNKQINGCEIATNTDTNNCGACSNVCAAANGTPKCSNGACSIGACNTGWADCDKQVANGCEQDVASDPKNCGACGNICLMANGTAACVKGTCQVAKCNIDFANCDQDAQNGCETGTVADKNNCGACGKVCDQNLAQTCQGGQCAAFCPDGVKNGAESDTDCGLTACKKCALAQSCYSHGDCVSNNCFNGVCSPPFSCQDNIGGGGETDTDCGGPQCNPCADKKRCLEGRDCASGVCKGLVCQAASCSDIVKNGLESDTDCGGGGCKRCADFKVCQNIGDCESGVCSNNRCQPASCSDLVKNGLESDTDCGGGQCPQCGNGLRCLVGGDCASRVCSGGLCSPPTCFDRVKNNNETGLDCGANCSKCPDSSGCNGGGDCQSGVCIGGLCVAGSCSDGVKNNQETDLDCGAKCAPCSDGKACSIAGDCQSKVCSGTCQAPTCNDGATNGLETDRNCGGGVCPSCVGGQVCQLDRDCASSYCSNSFCQNCPRGFTDSCGGCVNLAKDPDNCGACGYACTLYPNTQSRPCNGGWCNMGPCNTGFLNCNGWTFDGCEADTTNDAGNCGGCGKVCSFSNATAICAQSACSIGACQPGFANCDQQTANGCEQRTDNNLSHCGTCGQVCSPLNSSPVCANGACGFTQCNAGFASCDGNAANGCEIATTTDAGNCGGCGKICLQNQPCTGGLCQPVCNDGVKNASETDTDCGGNVCGKCTDGKFCGVNGDCVGGLCSAGKCVGTCNDLVKNGAETDVDCGTFCPNKCPAKAGCLKGSDCQSGVCTNNLCVASCSDGIKNQNETDADCGGVCPKCANTKACLGGFDCQSGVCSMNVCAVPSCNDGVKNGTESDLDCGGACQGKCAAGKTCVGGGDCASNVCTNTVCQGIPPSCANGIKDNAESDLDCGGGLCPRCADTKACGVGADCSSGVCSAGKCAAPTCADLVKNGTETDTDCGNGCQSKCADGKVCSIGSDCQSGVCANGVCQVATCNDGVKNVKETDTDCGGGTCAGCANGKACVVNADCGSSICSLNVCATPGPGADLHGRTPSGASGANGGPLPDGNPDNYDADGDCYCAVGPCVGSSNPACKSLQGGDCDDTNTGKENHPGAFEWCDRYDNNCNGVVDENCGL